MPIQVIWYDNAAFRVDTGDGILWFDPSVNKNADSPITVDDISDPAKFVFTTHGDPGHFVNSVQIAQKTGANFVASQDLCDFVLNKGQLPSNKVISLKFGEKKAINGLEAFLFEAEHPELTVESTELISKWGGVKTRNGGFVVRGKEFSLCLLGDCIHSKVFREVGRRFQIDFGMIPIQGRIQIHSTPEEAAENGARIVRDLKIKVLFPVIQYTREQVRLEPLKRKLQEMGVKTRIIFDPPGTVHTFDSYDGICREE